MMKVINLGWFGKWSISRIVECAKESEPTDWFCRAFMAGGSLRIECSCGRTYFGSEGDYCKGELERLREHAKDEPDRYIEVAYDSVDWLQVDGGVIVTDCVCHRAGRYERFIWNHRDEIADYLRERSRSEAEVANATAKSME